MYVPLFAVASDSGSDKEPRFKVPLLEPAIEEELVEFFIANPIFYDKSLMDFKDQKKKDALMEDAAKKAGLTVDMLRCVLYACNSLIIISIYVYDMTIICYRTWYRSQRTSYSRLIRTKSGQRRRPFTCRQKWILDKFG